MPNIESIRGTPTDSQLPDAYLKYYIPSGG